MKKQYQGYDIGSKVFAISTCLSENKDTYHYAIFPVIIKSVMFNENSVEYEVTTPKGKLWNDVVSNNEISDSFTVLANKLKSIWIEHAEWD